MLYQVQGGKKRVVAYTSRSVSTSEANYPAHKLEFLALKWAITEKFHDYHYGGNVFDVYTDNNPLTYILTSAKLDACGQRWVTRLANYNFSLHYRAGMINVGADALSRIQWPTVLSKPEDSELVETISCQSIKAICCSTNLSCGYFETLCHNAGAIPTKYVAQEALLDWRSEQLKDQCLKELISLLESNKLNARRIKKNDSKVIKNFLRMKAHLTLKDGVLFRRTYSDNSKSKQSVYQVVLPEFMKSKVLKGCHDQVGHQGRVRTLSLLKERFFWPGMSQDTQSHVGKCRKCLKRKATPHVAPLQPIVVSQPLELVHLDFLSIEPSKGNIENVLVITDHFTRYALAFPSKTQTAQATAKILWNNFIVHYGFPEKFLSDQGRNFESDLITELCKLAGVAKLHTTPYHPMTNGMCERFNSTLCNMLGTLNEEEKSGKPILEL